MLEFIRLYWIDILVFVLFTSGCILIYKDGKKAVVKKIVLGLVVKAEKALGSGTGELKYALVVDTFYSKLPLSIRFLFTRKDIDTYIEEGVTKLKEILSQGVNLNGYDVENNNIKNIG